MLRPWLTEVRETFTRGGGPWVWIEKLLHGFFLVLLKLQGWAKKWRNLAYFQTPPANFLLSRPNAAEYCNSEKNLLSIDGCSTRVPRFVNFGVKTPEIHAPYYCSYKLIDWDMFYFHSLDGSTTTRKRLCVFGGRGRGRGLCVFGGLCVDMWRLVHQWPFMLFWLSFDCLWTPAQRKRASMLYFANVFLFIFFYGRLILRPWLTEVRESFTRGGPWVALEKLLLGFFPGHP